MAERSDNGSVYELSGPVDAPVVVLIHGLGLNRHVWQWHEPALASGFRVLNYDLFGHGDSAPPPAIPPSIAMDPGSKSGMGKSSFKFDRRSTSVNLHRFTNCIHNLPQAIVIGVPDAHPGICHVTALDRLCC